MVCRQGSEVQENKRRKQYNKTHLVRTNETEKPRRAETTRTVTAREDSRWCVLRSYKNSLKLSLAVTGWFVGVSGIVEWQNGKSDRIAKRRVAACVIHNAQLSSSLSQAWSGSACCAFRLVRWHGIALSNLTADAMQSLKNKYAS